jgi:hypothetical protein
VLSLLSHARARPQVFSRHRVLSPAASCFTGPVFSTETIFGGSGPGGSGAPVINGRGEVVGQLRGGCGPRPGDGCDEETQVHFGRFSEAYPQIQRWLESEGVGEDGYLRSAAFPDFKFKVDITAGDLVIPGAQENDCLPETLCVSGALPGRSEVFLRIVGPRPNGKLWPTLVKFTTSRVDVWIVQESTGVEKHYVLEGASPGFDELPGRFDRDGFEP